MSHKDNEVQLGLLEAKTSLAWVMILSMASVVCKYPTIN